MGTQTRYSLADLGRVAGVTPRTVRYYIVQGLLPGANESGPGAWYDEGHLARLRLVRELQRQHLPLAEIRGRLTQLGDAEVAELLETQGEAPVPAEGSALDYIRSVLGAAGPKPLPDSMRSYASPPAPPAALMFRSTPAPPLMRTRASRMEVSLHASDPIGLSELIEPNEPNEPNEPSALAQQDTTTPNPTTPPTPTWSSYADAGSKPTTAPTAERSQWDRIALTPDIELHVRRPLSRQDNRRLERLITIARQVLGEEKP